MKANFWVGFEKAAAPKWVKEFRRGKLSLSNLAQVAKAQKKERLISNLGTGREGVADLVSYPGSPNGLATRKMFDPGAPGYSAENFLIRAAMQKALSATHPKNIAHFYGMHPDKPILYREYIAPKLKKVAQYLALRLLPSKDPVLGVGKRVLDSMNSTLKKLKLPKMIDVHEGNVLKVGRTPKIIDFLPEHMAEHISKIQEHEVPKNLRETMFKRS